MDRKAFLRCIGSSCLAAAGAPFLLTGCTTIHRVHSPVKQNTLTLGKNEFTVQKEEEEKIRNVVVVSADPLPFPIAVYRLSQEEYMALWMECTHQGCEVNPQPHYIICPCHGSEFDARGQVVQGPAENNLKNFKTTTDHENIYIHL